MSTENVSKEQKGNDANRVLGTVNLIMEKYYFKTIGQEPNVTCIEKCKSKYKPSEGVMIGSATCQECKCCKETDIDEWGDVSWIKCSDLTGALIGS